jgi:hypothetical protein
MIPPVWDSMRLLRLLTMGEIVGFHADRHFPDYLLVSFEENPEGPDRPESL